MSLSICLVTRNAAHCLATALGSVAGLGAQRIVVDTGSTDDTVDLAQRLGATVLRRRLAGRFRRGTKRGVGGGNGRVGAVAQSR